MIRLNKTLILPILIVCLNSCEPNNGNIINEVVENYKNHHSISYHVNYTMKSFSSDEPSSIKCSVLIERDKNDTVFGGKFLYRPLHNGGHSKIKKLKYYDLNNIFLIDGKHGVIYKFNPQTDGVSAIEGSPDGEIIETYFLQPNKLKSMIDAEANIVTYSDSANFVKVDIRFPDNGEFYDIRESLYINKSKNIIEKITSQVKYKDLIQKRKWVISNIVFDSVDDETFRNKVGKYFANYRIEEYEPLTEEDYKLIEKGETAPPIKGYVFPDYSKKTEIETNKITVLDFWYTTCMPCIKAIPQLNKLKEKYEGQIQIIGVNDIENKPDQKNKIKSFLKRTPIEYQILLVDEIPEAYNIRAYPTLYIIGKDNKVKYAEMGYSENLFKRLDKEINELIESNLLPAGG